MNKNKICFVSVVKDERSYTECLKYIEHLNCPKGYSLEAMDVRDSNSMTAAYNEAIKRSDAKYKIYLNQNTLILNRNFIVDMLKIFENKKVGLIGMVGATNIPKSGVWREGEPLAGAVYDNHTGEMGIVSYSKSNDKAYTKVMSVDGLCICTQYDVSWREDLFDGWHFYDSSQCLEFVRAGYDCVVPNQDKPWCLHDCGIKSLSGYEKYKEIFAKEYLSEYLDG